MAEQEQELHHGLRVLPPAAGYGIVIGIGSFFAIVMLCITWMQNRYVRFTYLLSIYLSKKGSKVNE